MGATQTEFTLKARPKGCHLVTAEVLSHLPELPQCGVLQLFVKHTSAALSINENADPGVRRDLNASLDHTFPENEPYYTQATASLIWVLGKGYIYVNSATTADHATLWQLYYSDFHGRGDSTDSKSPVTGCCSSIRSACR